MKDTCNECGYVYDETEYMELMRFLDPAQKTEYEKTLLCPTCYLELFQPRFSVRKA